MGWKRFVSEVMRRWVLFFSLLQFLALPLALPLMSMSKRLWQESRPCYKNGKERKENECAAACSFVLAGFFFSSGVNWTKTKPQKKTYAETRGTSPNKRCQTWRSPVFPSYIIRMPISREYPYEITDCWCCCEGLKPGYWGVNCGHSIWKFETVSYLYFLFLFFPFF